MLLRETTMKHYVNGPYNCAEAVLLMAREELGLPVEDGAVRALGAFGGGMGCGELCGAIAGACSAVGVALIEDAAHNSPNLRPTAAAVAEHFLQKYGSLRCADLKPMCVHPDFRCGALVEEAVDCAARAIADASVQK